MFLLLCNDIVVWFLCYVLIDWYKLLDMFSKSLFSDIFMFLLDGDNL